MEHGDSFKRVTVSTLFLYTCPVLVVRETPREQPRPFSTFNYTYALQLQRGAATMCKDEKWAGLPSLSSSNHKHRAGVKK